MATLPASETEVTVSAGLALLIREFAERSYCKRIDVHGVGVSGWCVGCWPASMPLEGGPGDFAFVEINLELGCFEQEGILFCIVIGGWCFHQQGFADVLAYTLVEEILFHAVISNAGLFKGVVELGNILRDTEFSSSMSAS